jgi:hypothetical protein
MNRIIDFIAGSVMCLLLAPGCGCQENSGSDRDASDDGDLDGEEDAPDRYEGPIAELWEGKIPINVFGSNREFIGFPEVVSDRNGGAILIGGCYCCYDPVEGTHPGGVMQRISPSGEKLWGENGILISQGGIWLIFPLADASAYVLGGYTSDAEEDIYFIGLMHPDGQIEYDRSYYFDKTMVPDIDKMRFLITQDELLLASIEQSFSSVNDGDWCFLGLDRNLDSWTGGIQYGASRGHRRRACPGIQNQEETGPRGVDLIHGLSARKVLPGVPAGKPEGLLCGIQRGTVDEHPGLFLCRRGARFSL